MIHLSYYFQYSQKLSPLFIMYTFNSNNNSYNNNNDNHNHNYNHNKNVMINNNIYNLYGLY